MVANTKAVMKTALNVAQKQLTKPSGKKTGPVYGYRLLFDREECVIHSITGYEVIKASDKTIWFKDFETDKKESLNGHTHQWFFEEGAAREFIVALSLELIDELTRRLKNSRRIIAGLQNKKILIRLIRQHN